MSLQYLFDPNTQFQSRGGVNEVGGFLRVFFNGTDDRATTYCNFDGGMNEPDIVLDTDGRAVVIVDDTKTYRLEVYNRFGGLMWTVTNYKARGGGGGGSGTPVSVEGTVDEIDVTESEEGGIKHFVVSLANAVKTALSNLQSSITSLSLSLNGKKNVQTPSSFNGSTTKTLVGISQDANGEMSATFKDISFPDYSQRFENIENEQAVDAKVIASALNDLNARMESVEDSQCDKNIGERIADSLDSQNLFEGGIRVKVRQAAKSLDGTTNKTVTNISQDENGVITVTYSDISFPDWTSAITAATDLCEKLANKKTTFSGFETSDTFYPTLKAVVDYLDSRLQNLGGKKITNNGQPFTNYSQLPSSTPYYSQNINTDDYAYVQDTGLASRYTATVTGSSVLWTLDYEISLPVFTAEQQAAIDSGVNSTKVGNYDSHISNTSNPHNVTAAQIGAVRYDTASQGLSGTQKQNARTNIGAGTYSVPSGGIPKTDLASGVQSSLDKADSALQNHQSVVNSAPTLSWGNTSTVGSVGGTALTVKMPSNPATGKLDTNGDGSNVTTSFTQAGSRANISAGEKLSVIFGKISKWFADLKSVAFSGSYTDLSDKPTIPAAANNGILTIKQNGTSKGTFSANQSGNNTIELTDTTKAEVNNNASGNILFTTSNTSGTITPYIGNNLSVDPTKGFTGVMAGTIGANSTLGFNIDVSGFNNHIIPTSSGDSLRDFFSKVKKLQVDMDAAPNCVPIDCAVESYITEPCFYLYIYRGIVGEGIPVRLTVGELWKVIKGFIGSTSATGLGLDKDYYTGTAYKAIYDDVGNQIRATYATRTALRNKSTSAFNEVNTTTPDANTYLYFEDIDMSVRLEIKNVSSTYYYGLVMKRNVKSESIQVSGSAMLTSQASGQPNPNSEIKRIWTSVNNVSWSNFGHFTVLQANASVDYAATGKIQFKCGSFMVSVDVSITKAGADTNAYVFMTGYTSPCVAGHNTIPVV